MAYEDGNSPHFLISETIWKLPHMFPNFPRCWNWTIRNLKVDDLCGHVLAVVRITPETRDVTVVLRGHYGETQSVHWLLSSICMYFKNPNTLKFCVLMSSNYKNPAETFRNRVLSSLIKSTILFLTRSPWWSLTCVWTKPDFLLFFVSI